MSNCSLQELLDNLNENLEFYRGALEAWKKVRFNYKKDGGEFADVTRKGVVEGASLVQSYSSRMVEVYFKIKGGYKKDTAWIKAEDERNQYGGYSTKAFSYASVKEAIEERIGYVEELAKEYADAVPKAANVFADFLLKMNKVYQGLAMSANPQLKREILEIAEQKRFYRYDSTINVND